MRGQRPLGIGNAQEVEHERQALAQPLVEEEEPPGDLLAGRLRAVLLGDAVDLPHELEHREVGDRLSVRDAVRVLHRNPRARQRWTNSQHRRLLPTPGSATMPTTCPWPSMARASAASSVATSAIRPTKREKPRGRDTRDRTSPRPGSRGRRRRTRRWYRSSFASAFFVTGPPSPTRWLVVREVF
jgi:hypothetical protein